MVPDEWKSEGGREGRQEGVEGRMNVGFPQVLIHNP